MGELQICIDAYSTSAELFHYIEHNQPCHIIKNISIAKKINYYYINYGICTLK